MVVTRDENDPRFPYLNHVVVLADGASYGATELLLAQQDLPERTRKRLLRIARAARQSTDITTALLHLVRAEQGTVDGSEAHSVAAVSGTVLAVCSCTVLPLFAGIYGMGAGLGPATTFLYSGPAINVMAIFLTARVLGIELGVARIIGSIVFAVIIGLLMALIFRKDSRT